MLRAALACLVLAAPAAAQEDAPRPLPAETEVDVELLLLVDVSRSMTYREVAIQRDGYAAAMRSDEVIAAISGGLTGRSAVAFAEWSGMGQIRVVVPWQAIDGREAADAFATVLETAPPLTMSRTSISYALRAGAAAFDGNGFRGIRRVIDISGDGPNNQGGDVRVSRDAALALGITINGLPLMTREGMGVEWHLEDLDRYYADCVTGGPGSFVIPVRDWEDFPEAVQRKLVLEFVGRVPEAQVRQVQFGEDEPYDCLVGEKIWERTRPWALP